jgi:predicted transcriptional regulator
LTFAYLRIHNFEVKSSVSSVLKQDQGECTNSQFAILHSVTYNFSNSFAYLRIHNFEVKSSVSSVLKQDQGECTNSQFAILHSVTHNFSNSFL